MIFNHGYFISGIGTDIGKTYVSSLLYKSLKSKTNTGYYKPIQSGCKEVKGEIIAVDPKFLTDFNNMTYDPSMCTFKLIPEVSPHLASEIEGAIIDTNIIKEEIKNKLSEFSTLLVEGAGGVYVPIIRGKYYIFDLIIDTHLPVILVTNTKVGSISNTMTTIHFLRSHNIPIQGLIFNNYVGEIYEDDNIRVILEDSGIENYIKVKKNQVLINDNDIENLFR